MADPYQWTTPGRSARAGLGELQMQAELRRSIAEWTRPSEPQSAAETRAVAEAGSMCVYKVHLPLAAPCAFQAPPCK